MINWIKDRLSERTTWDGAGLVAVGVIVLMFDGLSGPEKCLSDNGY